jgi:uncharacterized protein
MLTLLLDGTIYALIGVFAGLMAGLFGIGGGLVVVPGLLFVFEKNHLIPNSMVMYAALGTSLAAMVITTTAAVKAHAKIGPILWPIFYTLWPGLVLGTLFGSVLATWVPTEGLTIFFAIFLLFVSFKMLTEVKANPSKRFPAKWVQHSLTFFIGTNSGLLGVGGGILIVPYLTYCGIQVRKIAGLSNVCALVIAMVGASAFIITGYQATGLIPYMTGYIYWPAVLLISIPSSLMAPIGARLSYKLPLKQLKYGFVALLILTAIKMLF